METAHILAITARREAEKDWHGSVDGKLPNIQPLIAPFPPMAMENWDGRWCAAFVHYCCRLAGVSLPARPAACRSCTLAGCKAWEEWAMAEPEVGYHPGMDRTFQPRPGDIVLYDRVFEDHPHDHIGIVLAVEPGRLLTAEGNVENRSAILYRNRDEHIRAYIRLPENKTHKRKENAAMESVYIAPNATVVGDVKLENNVNIWYGAVLRGDSGAISVEEGSNIQDNCVIHEETHIGRFCTIGHGAIVHGCTIGDGCLIGMGAILLDGAVLEEGCLVGAGALVTGKTRAGAGSVLLGSPAKVVKTLTPEQIRAQYESAEHYILLARRAFGQDGG